MKVSNIDNEGANVKGTWLCRLLLVLFLPTLTSSPTLAQSERIEEINGKVFLVLPDEEPPENMIWGAFGEEIERYFGVPAYSNGAAEDGKRKYQCTELIHRFLRVVYGIPTRIGMGLGHGRDLAKGIAGRFGDSHQARGLIEGYIIHLEYFENEKTAYPPVVGSIVSMHFNSRREGYGHVGIIRTMETHSDGSVSGFLFDQHGAIHKTVGLSIKPDKVVFRKDDNGIWSAQVESWKFKRYFPVIGWTNVVVQQRDR